MEQHENHSTLEVDGAHIPELAPDTSLPEAINIGQKEAGFWSPMRTNQEKLGTVARIRAILIWIAFASIVTIGIAVGVGVGMTRHNRSGQSHSEADKSATYQRGVSSASRLAATNYTDAQGGEHSQVYYQDKSLEIWIANWSGSFGSWTTSPVLPKDNTSVIHPKNGTPIAAYNWWSIYNTGTDQASDFRCVFIDNNYLIRALGARNRSDSEWFILMVLDGVLAASEESGLIGYTPQCDNKTCDPSDFLGYENPKDELWMQYPLGGGESGTFIPAGVRPDAGTAMAITPITVFKPGKAPEPRVALYLVSANTLVELNGAANRGWWSTGVGLNGKKLVDSGAQLAAMSQLSDGSVDIQVLITRSNGGVKLAYWNGHKAVWNFVELVKGMEEVLPLSPIAATQLGRVYALENGPQIVEWRIVTGDQPPTFERVGVVDTGS